MRGKGFPENKSAGSYQCMPGGSAVCLSIRIYRISETEGKSFRPHQIEETSEKPMAVPVTPAVVNAMEIACSIGIWRRTHPANTTKNGGTVHEKVEMEMKIRYAFCLFLHLFFVSCHNLRISVSSPFRGKHVPLRRVL